jgi:SAM-dependent methyltransferase
MIKLVKNLVKNISPEAKTKAEGTSEPNVRLSNLDYNKKIWDGYAKWWSKEGVNAEDPRINEDKAARLKYLGDEWGVAADVDMIVEQYIYPYVTQKSIVGEIGSGGGRIASRVVHRCGQLYCFDISKEMLAKVELALSDCKNVQYVLLNDCQFGAELDGKFDFVYAFDVFLHLDLHNIWKYFCGIARLLKPGGKTFVHTANLKAPGGWERFASQDSYAVEGHYFLCPEMIGILAEHSGFKIVKASTPDPGNFYLNRDYLVVLEK